MTYSIIKRFGWSIKSAALLVGILCVLSLIVFKPLEQVSAQANSVLISPLGQDLQMFTPHQIVRTNRDRVFIFAAQAQYSSVLVGYWTTAAGLPTATSSFNGTTTVTEADNIISVDAAYDGTDHYSCID